jgi:hypothetical protein
MDMAWYAVRTHVPRVDGELLVGSVWFGLGGHGERLRRSRWRSRGGIAGCLTRRPDISERGNHPLLIHAWPSARGSVGVDRCDVR